MSEQEYIQPVTVRTLAELKKKGEKIVCLTAYDASFAAIEDAAGVEVVLVGDSLGMVIQGQRSTLPVTVDDMVYHTQCVARGVQRSLILSDMPFQSYANPDKALACAARLMQEGGAHMVKLEGGKVVYDSVKALTHWGIPVCGHLGLQPQSVNKLGGYRVQGRDDRQGALLLDEARFLEDAGVDLLVLECVPAALAAEISDMLSVPVIGIGAGSRCDGQVLVLYDLLGLSSMRQKFVKNFMTEADDVPAAISAYVHAVKQGEFPAEEHSFS